MFPFLSLWLLKKETCFFLYAFSGNDQLLPSQQEGEKLYKLLPNCQLRKFDDSGHFLLLVFFFHLYFFAVVCLHSNMHYHLMQVLTDSKMIACSLLAGRQHWPCNHPQGNFLLPSQQVSRLCFWFHTAYPLWSQRSNRIKQVMKT